MTQTTTITLAELLQENIDLTVNMNKRHVDVQIMGVITPQAKQNAATRYICYNQHNGIVLNCFILCSVVAKASSLVYIMMTAEMNGRIFHQD